MVCFSPVTLNLQQVRNPPLTGVLLIKQQTFMDDFVHFTLISDLIKFLNFQTLLNNYSPKCLMIHFSLVGDNVCIAAVNIFFKFKVQLTEL